MKKRILALLLAAALVVALAACGDSGTDTGSSTPAEEPASSDNAGTDDGDTGDTGDENPSTSPAEGGNLSITLASSPETIDPHMNSAVDGATYLAHLNEGLYRNKWDGTGVEYGLAESHTVSDDGLVWTVTIREDAKWSDGQPVTAEDFVYSWRRMVDQETAAPYAGDMGQFILNGEEIALDEETSLTPEDLGVKAIDERILEITLAGPCPFFEEILAFPTLMPVREDMIRDNGDSWTRSGDTYLTAGPFRLESFTLDQDMVVVPNEYYYDVNKLVPSSITFQFLADDRAEMNALLAGEVVFADNLPTEEVANMKDQGYYGQIAQLGTYYVNFNHTVAPLDDVNVRKALSLAIDREYIANTVKQGTVIAADAFVGYGFADAASGNEFRVVGGPYFEASDYEANKELARQALADAGYPDGEGFPHLEYMYNNDSGHQAIGEAMQAMWKEVLNIDVEMANQEWGVFTATRRNGEHQMARDGWIADYNDPLAMLTIFFTGGGNNSTFYSNTEYDSLLTTANQSNDRQERMDAMHKAEEILIQEDWAVAPIYYYADEYLAVPELQDWAISPLGYKFFHRAYVAE